MTMHYDDLTKVTCSFGLLDHGRKTDKPFWSNALAYRVVPGSWFLVEPYEEDSTGTENISFRNYYEHFEKVQVHGKKRERNHVHPHEKVWSES